MLSWQSIMFFRGEIKIITCRCSCQSLFLKTGKRRWISFQLFLATQSEIESSLVGAVLKVGEHKESTKITWTRLLICVIVFGSNQTERLNWLNSYWLNPVISDGYNIVVLKVDGGVGCLQGGWDKEHLLVLISFIIQCCCIVPVSLCDHHCHFNW